MKGGKRGVRRSRERRAHFVFVDQTPLAVVIRDVGPWDRHPTVTNDAEDVVRRIAPILEGRRLFYFDSEGELTELLIKESKFAGFAAVKVLQGLVTEEQISRAS